MGGGHHFGGKRWVTVAGLALVLAGFLVLVFPPVARLVTGSAQASEVAQYVSRANSLTHTRFQDAVAANEKGDFGVAGRLLAVDGAEAVARLRIPRIGVDLPVYPSSSDRDLGRGAGHLEGTAWPVGGVGTHSAVTAHSGMPTARMFDRLPALDVGDKVFVEVLGEVLAYEVIATVVDTPEDGAHRLGAVAGEDRLTLITCTPYGVNTHRLLVTARRLPAAEGMAVTGPPLRADASGWVLVAVIAAVGGPASGWAWKRTNKQERKEVSQ